MLSPQKHTFETIWGNGGAVRLVPKLLGTGRLPHAFLLHGPDAIGKRSLAFAMAKAILSAGRPVQESTVSALGPARAQRQVPDEEPEDDLFGEAEDLFASADVKAEPDLFGDTPPPVAERPPEPPKPEAPPPPKPTQPPSIPKPTMRTQVAYRGFDERVCRLVEASYPPEYDKEWRPTTPGHPDLTIVEPASGRRGVLVDQVRYLQTIANSPPIEGAFRVILIFGADTITQEGGNSVLKLLEEPPSYLVMILVANRVTSVLPTIRSRCSVIPMSPMAREDLVEKLVDGENLDRTVARVAAALSEGRPGAALSAIESSLLERRRKVFDARLQIDRFKEAAIASAAERIAASGSMDEILWLLTSFARDRLVRQYAADHPDLLVHGDALDLIDSVKGEGERISDEAERLLDAYKLLAHPFLPNQRAALQMALWPG